MLSAFARAVVRGPVAGPSDPVDVFSVQRRSAPARSDGHAGEGNNAVSDPQRQAAPKLSEEGALVTHTDGRTDQLPLAMFWLKDSLLVRRLAQLFSLMLKWTDYQT